MTNQRIDQQGPIGVLFGKPREDPDNRAGVEERLLHVREGAVGSEALHRGHVPVDGRAGGRAVGRSDHRQGEGVQPVAQP